MGHMIWSCDSPVPVSYPGTGLLSGIRSPIFPDYKTPFMTGEFFWKALLLRR
jgi:hypothetical protein